MNKTKTALIDLHLHFDGSLPLDCIKYLAKLQTIQIPDDEEKLKNLIQVSASCNDLNEYLKCFAFPLELLQTTQAISHAIFSLAEKLKNDGLLYAEIRFAPQLHTRKGLTQQQVVEAALEGLSKSTFDANIILCCMTGNDNHAENIETLHIAENCIAKKQDIKGVVAIDLAGAEALFELNNNKDIFDYAFDNNIPATIHVGEAKDSKNIWKALGFHTTRFGHGVMSYTDTKLLDEISHRKITLELCPTSNLQTKVFTSIYDFPLPSFLEHDVPITINTDNMTVSGTTLQDEIDLVSKTFNLTTKQIYQLQKNSVNASFASTDIKAKLLKQLDLLF